MNKIQTDAQSLNHMNRNSDTKRQKGRATFIRDVNEYSKNDHVLPDFKRHIVLWCSLTLNIFTFTLL